jgi:hypothetical protein
MLRDDATVRVAAHAGEEAVSIPNRESPYATFIGHHPGCRYSLLPTRTTCIRLSPMTRTERPGVS